MRNKNPVSCERKAVVLLSGGLDSATTLFMAKEKGFRCFCLIFDYGQRHKKEISAAKKIAQIARCPARIVRINLAWKGSALLDRNIKIPFRQAGIPSTYVPARNIIFLSFALSYAETVNAEAIFIGAHARDYSGYPDCRPEFYRAFSKVIACGTKSGVEKKRIRIYTPLINKSKAQIIKSGANLGVPWALTWSCYRGDKLPCAKCDSCYYRAKGFKQTGFEDPLLVRS